MAGTAGADEPQESAHHMSENTSKKPSLEEQVDMLTSLVTKLVQAQSSATVQKSTPEKSDAKTPKAGTKWGVPYRDQFDRERCDYQDGSYSVKAHTKNHDVLYVSVYGCNHTSLGEAGKALGLK